MKLLFTIISVMLYVSQSRAQTVIQGRVTDGQKTGQVLAGATVVALPGMQGTTTDSSGHFEVRSDQPVTSVQVSYIGFKTQTLAVRDGETVLPVVMVANENQMLEEVRVTSRYYKQYSVGTVSSALRLQTPLIDLSQNIVAITPEILFDQGSMNMTENVTRNVSGATRLDISNNYGPFIFMRGGQISTLRNGVDFTPINRGPIPEDAAVIERVEFVKGPSLFMNNLGDPAGTFNILTKQATGERKYSIQTQLGSFGLYRLSTDLGGTLDKKGKLAYRFNAMGMTTNSFVKFDFLNRYLVAPVIRYKFSEKTSVSAEYTYQYMTYLLFNPTVASQTGYNTLPRDFVIADPKLPPYRVSDHTAFLTFSHTFNANWSLTARGTMLDNVRKGYYLFSRRIDAANRNIQLRNLNNDEELYRVYSQQLFVNGKINTGAITHQLLTGIDVNQKRSYQDTRQFNTVVDAKGVTQQRFYPLDITNPVYGENDFPTYNVPGGIEASPLNASIRYYSIYALDEIALFKNKLRLTIGGRYTAIKTDTRTATTEFQADNKKITPRLGISYSISPTFSLYALYDETLRPQTGLTLDGQKVEPQEGINQEVGVKKNWFNNRFTSSVSVYKIERKNIAQGDPVNPGFSLLVGKQKGSGVEIDLMGEVAKGLNVVVNYAYSDSKITDDVNAKLVGTPTGTYVRNIQNTWLNYTLPLRKTNGLTLSMGYQYLNGRYERLVNADNISADPRRVTPDYFRLDGAIGWSSKKINLNLNINNILNEKLVGATYYSSNLYFYVPQPPLNFRLSAGYTF